MLFNRAEEALRQAYIVGDHCVGWTGEGWNVYDPKKGAEEGVQPEFLCLNGAHPVPLNDSAINVWVSIVRQGLQEVAMAA